MKYFFLFCAILLFPFLQQSSFAQKKSLIIEKADSIIFLQQADSIRLRLEADGFKPVREEFVQMFNQYELEIQMPLYGKTIYHFVFIAEKTSRRTELKLYDAEGKKIRREINMQEDPSGNVIRVSYNPFMNGMAQFSLLQVNSKKKNHEKLHGYVMLLKKTST